MPPHRPTMKVCVVLFCDCFGSLVRESLSKATSKVCSGLSLICLSLVCLCVSLVSGQVLVWKHPSWSVCLLRKDVSLSHCSKMLQWLFLWTYHRIGGIITPSQEKTCQRAMNDMNKEYIREQILEQLRQERETLTAAAKATYEAATHEESAAENQYDTRGLEASYLAGAQAKRLSEIEAAIHAYEQLQLQTFDAQTPIIVSAWIELENEEGKRCYFLGPQAGGMKLRTKEGLEGVVITPFSPLGRQLLKAREGDAIEVDKGNDVLEYEILSVK